MLKHLSQLDEVVQAHKSTTPLTGNLDLKTKKTIQEKDKLINPKQIFELMKVMKIGENLIGFVLNVNLYNQKQLNYLC